jgi:hypothetical protein
MKFEQRSAGNAQKHETARRGAPATPLFHLMNRRPTLLIALVLALALPVPAHAADPLLSGYAGPGSGEQVLLGGGKLGGGSGGKGSGGAAAAVPSLRTPAPGGLASNSAGTAADTPATTGHKTRATSSSKRKHAMSTSPRSSKTSTTAAPAGAPPVVAYPTHAGAVEGLPLSVGEALLAIAALALLVLGGLGLRRLSDQTDPPSSPPQVPVP